jgi:hypothetical protein
MRGAAVLSDFQTTPPAMSHNVTVWKAGSASAQTKQITELSRLVVETRTEEATLTWEENRKVGLAWDLSDGVTQVNVDPLTVEGTARRLGCVGVRGDEPSVLVRTWVVSSVLRRVWQSSV